MPDVTVLTDEELAAKACEFLRRRRLEKQHADKKAALGLEIRTELARRGHGLGQPLTVLGVRIRIKASTTSHYTADAVKARLGRRARAFLFTAVDSTKLRQAKADGEISGEDLAACIGHVSSGKAYVDVDQLDEAKAA